MKTKKHINVLIYAFALLVLCVGCGMKKQVDVKYQVVNESVVMTTTSVENITERSQAENTTETTPEEVISTETTHVETTSAESLKLETIPPETTSEATIPTNTASDSGAQIVYATEIVNIRNKPTTKGNIVGQTDINQQFLCLEKMDSGWYMLQANDVIVYGYGKYFSDKPTTKKQNDDPYTYEDMLADISRLDEKYTSGFKSEVLGQSYDNRDIFLLTIGNPDAEKAVLFTAAIHGAEYITTQLVMAQVEYYLDNLKEEYDGATIEEILNKVCIYVIPMVNPDSVAINQNGFFVIRNEELRKNLFEMEYTNIWSSNAHGVDLNRNFPTDGFGNENGAMQDYSIPSYKYYEGEYAASEKETQLIIDFVTSKDNLNAYISYHSKGEVIYWNKGQKGELYNNTSNIVKIIAKLTGYKDINDYQVKSGIDYEWAILERGIPGCTVEVGDMDSFFPVRQTQWQDIWERNQYVMIAVTKYAFN